MPGQADNLAVSEISTMCPCSGPFGGGRWKNHGTYVSCVIKAAKNITGEDGQINQGMIASNAAKSKCGKSTSNVNPVVTLLFPQDQQVTQESTIAVSGYVDDPLATIYINGQLVGNTNGDFSIASIALVLGVNTIEVIAINRNGNEGRASVQVVREGNIENQLPVAIAFSSSSVVLSYTEVVLDGSLSHDLDGSITSYHWQQMTGPTVDLETTSEPIAKFRAPIVTSVEPASFRLTVVDDKNAESNAEAGIDILPTSPSQLKVALLSFEYRKPAEPTNGHADHITVEGPPIVNEKIAVRATLSGLIKDIAFEFRDLNGDLISPLSLQRLGESSIPPYRYGGYVTIPNTTFVVAANGTTFDGQGYYVSSDNVYTPESFRLYFNLSHVELAPGEHLFVNLVIENANSDDSFVVAYRDPHGLLIDPYANPTAIQVPSGTSKILKLEIGMPIDAVVGDTILLAVDVSNGTNLDNPLTAEFSMSAEEPL